jgi:eukaryotic-like serine/threonine-protein kinase
MAISDTLGLVGTTVADKYDVLETVGEGATAVVYRAMHRIWKRPVALKIFKALGDVSVEKRDELLAKLVQEGQVLAELSERSAAIVQARDVGTFTTPQGESAPYMVLEWLDGATLESVLAREIHDGLPLRGLDESMALLEPIAEALAIAHKRGVVHRDVKPSNLFLLGDPRGVGCIVKLLDFGIAKVVAEVHKAEGGFTKTTGELSSFTPAYAAPEQFSRSHGATGPWTDVFALALILTEMLAGKSSLDGDDYGQLAAASTHPTCRPTPRFIGVSVPDVVEQVFARALAVKPEARYASVGEFWMELRRATNSEVARGFMTTASISSPSRHSTLVSGAPPANSLSSSVGSEPTLRRALLARVAVAVAMTAVALGAIGLVASRVRDTPSNAAPSVVRSSSAPAIAPPPVPACAAGMILIPGGKFFMGSDDKNDLALERPAHKVTLASFCIDTFEVTTEDYRACSDQGECRRASQTNEWEGISAKERKAFDPLCNTRDPAVRSRHPINCIDWDQAVEFCKAKKKRLPTEAEWEYAARGPDGRKYPWGDEEPAPNLLNACGKECLAWGKKNGVDEQAMFKADDGWETTAPVGSFPRGASRYGVQDVVGNVWEWVSDYFDDYKPDELDNPTGPITGEMRVIRGGAWNGAFASWVRPTFRYRDIPSKRSYGIGFRCASDLL